MNRSLATKINFIILISLIISLLGFYLKLFMSYETPILIGVGLIATVPVIISAIQALKNRKVTVDLLASIALAVSLINREWASVAFINLMITSARIFGDYTEGKADDAIKGLLKLRPEKVKIKTNDGTNIVGIENVKIGDLVIVEAGDRVPVDGVIEVGEANIDQSSLTGESIPVTKIKGQKVFSSTLNLSGSFILKTEKVGKDTTFEKIIALIQEAQDSKQGIQGIADRFATIYIVVTLLGSLALYIITQNTNLILAVLLVACADDIAIAIPMAFWGAIAKAGKHGIIIKGGEFLEGLSNLQTIIMDKTGTITKGTIKTEKIISLNSFKSSELLRIVGNVESVSEHPIAKAIVAHAVSDGMKIKTPEKFNEVAGKGIVAYQNKKKVVVGNLKLLKDEKIEINEEEIKQAEKEQKEGYLVIFIGIDKKLAGLLTLADEIRHDAKGTIYNLKKLGVKNTIMLTGDNELVAARVAKEVGINVFHANLLPEDKLKYIKDEISKSKGKVAMVGDGVNDAAALKLADVGIAMGAIGSDAAIESADIALMQDNLSKIVESVKLSRYTKNIAKQNFIIWGTVNAIGLVLVFSRTIGPEGASAFNFVTDFFPILNALRVFRYKITV